MSAEATNKAGWLKRLEQTRATWEAIVAEVHESDMERPGAMGDWTFKDLAAHLNGWRARTVSRLEAAAGGGASPAPPWPAELDDDTDDGVDAVNRWIYEQNRDRPESEILAEARDQFRRMRAAVEAIPEEDLVTPGRYPWLGGHPLAAVIQGAHEHLTEEHEPSLRAWLAERSR